jgi:hypothetical protein
MRPNYLRAYSQFSLRIVTVTSPGSQTGTVGTKVRLQIHASDSAPGQTLAYTAWGLPGGLSISPATGLITGIPPGAPRP